MQLWTDYEGVTIDGAFPLRKLLMPEGRSAFFSTAGLHGEPTVVRVIECHFDEEEILSRWRCVEALSHPNFLKFERFGQTEIDGRPVVYAVFEKVDGNLAEVLDQGTLTLHDVAQLASSLVAALEVLHTHGFVHEHLEPRNIFSITDVVKLRGDCIREAPEGDEGRALKQRDVQDLATVLLRALTQRESLKGIPDAAMPAPFAQIIRNGLDGTWGLDNIRAALGRQFGSNQPAAPTPVKAAPATAAVVDPRAVATPSPRPEAQLPPPRLKQSRNPESARATTPTARSNDSRSGTQGSRSGTQGSRSGTQGSLGDEQSFSLRSRWVGTGIAALLLLLFTWLLAHAWNAHRSKPTQASAVSQPAAQPAQHTAPIPTPNPAADSPSVNPPAAAVPHAGWRVIAFTYNHRSDAEKKVSDLTQHHPELQPTVFTPSGHAPYLVSIGGLMDRKSAHALARRSRSLGLPRDSYAQNYTH